MKYILMTLMILSSSYGFEYHLQPKKVADDVYCFFGALEKIAKENAGNVVNSCFVKTKEGFVVIDSGPTFSYAEQALKQMQKIENLPVKYVINTHDHDDHWLGNSFYKSQGALLLGPRTLEQNYVEGMQTRIQRIVGKELFGQTKIVKLDTVIENNLTLRFGGKKFEIQQPLPTAHTRGDLIVYLPKTKVLFAGDLVFNGRLTSLRDGSILGSLKALDIIDGYHAKYIITGHGYKTDENATREFRVYLSEIKKQVLKALDEDVGMDQITKTVKMPHFQKLKLYNDVHARTVLDAYKELELMDDEEE